MKLQHLALSGWRNLAPLELAFDPRLNLFVGQNAQGKTNLLEAIDYLATLRSFRARKAEELVQFGEGRARLRAEVERRGLLHRIEIDLAPPGRRVHLDGKPIRAASAYAGAMGATLFVPDDLALPRGSPSARRRFLDRAVFAALPAYLGEVQVFERLLKQRNAALRDGRSSLVLTFEEPLSRAAARLVVRRRAAVERLRPLLEQGYAAISGQGPRAGIDYRTVDWEAPLGQGTDEAAIAQAYAEALARRRPQDLARGHTGLGPHADDLDLFLDGRLVRAHASQGQTRAFVLALKIAEVSDFAAAWGDHPILLLDDVTSELDELRVQHLFAYLGSVDVQVFLTTTDPGLSPFLGAGARWRVANGRYQPGN